ncbi:restriction endonuclease subunit S, partial [Dolosicoccus paucivorans]|uniref:restriction endonuclease subunit S n=2 Tax=Dolosicoccus paucivorans TaxID=84521 RepID=UPI00087F7F5E
DWQQHQLKDLVIPVKGNSGDLSLPVLTISAGRGWLSQKERFGQTIAGNSLKRYTELPVGGLAYNRGASRSYWYGVTYVQDQHEKALVPNVYHSFLSKKNVMNELFVQQFFLANLADRELNKIITSSARRDGLLNINQKDFFNIKLFVPQIEEQEKIGEILKSLEKTISLNQQKLERILQLETAMIQKIFPDQNENSSFLYFSKNNSLWKKCKIGEILTERDDRITESETYPLMSFVQNEGVVPKSDRYDRSFLVKNSNKKYKRTELNDFIYSSNNLHTGSIGFNNYGKATISPVYSIFYAQNIVDSDFIGVLSKKPQFIHQMIRYRQGVIYGQWRIHEKDFLKIETLFPDNKERKKIVDYFKKINELRVLYSHKVNYLSNLKQYFLSQLFI